MPKFCPYFYRHDPLGLVYALKTLPLSKLTPRAKPPYAMPPQNPVAGKGRYFLMALFIATLDCPRVWKRCANDLRKILLLGEPFVMNENPEYLRRRWHLAPLVARELLAYSRQPWTYWLRLLSALGDRKSV